MIILIRNEIIRDRIIVGIHNAQLSEKLQMDSELTLEEAITQAQQAGTVSQSSEEWQTCQLQQWE